MQKTKKSIPENLKDEKYWLKRKKNNEAAKRARAKKKKVESTLEEQYMIVLKENQQFAKEIQRLRKENIALKVKYGEIKQEDIISMQTSLKLPVSLVVNSSDNSDASSKQLTMKIVKEALSSNNQNQFNLRKTIKKEISKSKQFQRHRSPPRTFNFCYKNNYPVNTENKTDKFNVAGNSQACFLQKYSRFQDTKTPAYSSNSKQPVSLLPSNQQLPVQHNCFQIPEGDRMAVDLLMNFKNSTQHQQPATQLIADIQKNNDQSHQDQGVIESKSQNSVCRNLQSPLKSNIDEGETSNKGTQQ